jgi:hypothetical protein
MKLRIEDLGNVFVTEAGALVIMGREKLRGPVAITFTAEETKWLVASLEDLKNGGLLPHFEK